MPWRCCTWSAACAATYAWSPTTCWARCRRCATCCCRCASSAAGPRPNRCARWKRRWNRNSASSSSPPAKSRAWAGAACATAAGAGVSFVSPAAPTRRCCRCRCRRATPRSSTASPPCTGPPACCCWRARFSPGAAAASACVLATPGTSPPTKPTRGHCRRCARRWAPSVPGARPNRRARSRWRMPLTAACWCANSRACRCWAARPTASASTPVRWRPTRRCCAKSAACASSPSAPRAKAPASAWTWTPTTPGTTTSCSGTARRWKSPAAIGWRPANGCSPNVGWRAFTARRCSPIPATCCRG